eukprot:scaffold80079_cov36-Tisochrysis_lutea.AAC.2
MNHTILMNESHECGVCNGRTTSIFHVSPFCGPSRRSMARWPISYTVNMMAPEGALLATRASMPRYKTRL